MACVAKTRCFNDIPSGPGFRRTCSQPLPSQSRQTRPNARALATGCHGSSGVVGARSSRWRRDSRPARPQACLQHRCRCFRRDHCYRESSSCCRFRQGLLLTGRRGHPDRSSSGCRHVTASRRRSGSGGRSSRSSAAVSEKVSVRCSSHATILPRCWPAGVVGEARGTYTQSSVTRLSSDAPGALARRHHRLHPSVGVPNGLRAIRMRDELGLARYAVRVFLGLGGGAAGRGLGRDLPLGHAGRDGDKIVLLARAVPLCNPSRRELRRLVRGAFGARGGGAGHCDCGKGCVFLCVWFVLSRELGGGNGQGGGRGRSLRFRRGGRPRRRAGGGSETTGVLYTGEREGAVPAGGCVGVTAEWEA